jgi:hypothetical protein
MIAKYEKQAIKSGMWFAGAAGVALVSMLVAMAMKDEPIGLGIFLAMTFVGGLLAMLILYFRGWYYLARARGYSAGVSLLGPILLVMEDKSNPAKEAEEEKYQGPRCVCCNIRISPTLKVCPKCGWTQPAVENLAVA